MYFVFAISGIFNLVWCYDVEICSDVLGLTVSEASLYRIGFVFVTIFSFLVLAGTELAVIAKNKLNHFKSVYNVVDSIILVFYWIFYSYFASYPEVAVYKSYNYATTIYLLLVVYRGVIQLRCID